MSWAESVEIIEIKGINLSEDASFWDKEKNPVLNLYTGEDWEDGDEDNQVMGEELVQNWNKRDNFMHLRYKWHSEHCGCHLYLEDFQEKVAEYVKKNPESEWHFQVIEIYQDRRTHGASTYHGYFRNGRFVTEKDFPQLDFPH